MNKQTEKKCQDCLHYIMCLERFRKLKKENHYILIDENEYFAHADDCEFHIKFTDVAKEIFANVEKVIRKHYKLPQYDLMYDIYKLKKKYESEGAE